MKNNISGITTINDVPQKGAATITPSTSAQTIAAGTYLTGAQIIAATAGTATAANVLSGKTFNSASGIGLTGSMKDNGAVSQILAANGTYTIPAGYHNGSGKITQSLTTKAATTWTPGTANKTAVAAGTYCSGTQTIKGDANLVASNIKKGVSIFGVSGTYDPGDSGLKMYTENISAANKYGSVSFNMDIGNFEKYWWKLESYHENGSLYSTIYLASWNTTMNATFTAYSGGFGKSNSFNNKSGSSNVLTWDGWGSYQVWVTINFTDKTISIMKSNDYGNAVVDTATYFLYDMKLTVCCQN